VDAGPPAQDLASLARSVGELAPDPTVDAGTLKVGKASIDWDLDAADPAMDYAERYIQATRRYKAEWRCVHAQPSRVEGGRTLVDVRDTHDDRCRGTGAVRDTFAVDVAQDHLDLADPSRGDPLTPWPDGSEPGGMPAAGPLEGPAMNEWHTQSPLPKALDELLLAPLRVQFYGRGSYPLITIAGWHASVMPTSSPAQLEDAAKKLCKASSNFPLGIVTAMDRSKVLRVKCPETTRWQDL
jgi:hypothetical protein